MLDKRWAVVTDYNKAISIISGIEKTCGKTVSKKIQSKHELKTEFTDGTKLIWVETSESSKGFRFGKMWCDERIDKEIFDLLIATSYFGKYENIIWV